MSDIALAANINTSSRPSDLKITDIRICNLVDLPMDASIIRIDTNQGISGYSEVRDLASPSYARGMWWIPSYNHRSNSY